MIISLWLSLYCCSLNIKVDNKCENKWKFDSMIQIVSDISSSSALCLTLSCSEGFPKSD